MILDWIILGALLTPVVIAMILAITATIGLIKDDLNSFK